jgi:hypothetical protein
VIPDVVPIIGPNQLNPCLLNISGSYFWPLVVMSKTTFHGMRYLLECELFLANVRKHHVYALRKTLLCVPDLAHHSDEVALNPSVSQEDRKAVASAFQSAFSWAKNKIFAGNISLLFSTYGSATPHPTNGLQEFIGGRSVVYHHWLTFDGRCCESSMTPSLIWYQIKLPYKNQCAPSSKQYFEST